jgi:ribosomal protein S18 acetylase RimI-like enzyme
MISYIESAEDIQADHLQGFFVGWPSPPSPTTHLKLLQNSDFVVLAVETESQRVVGFITAISDHVLSAYIPLLEVLPDYQRQGIGRELVRRLLARLEHLYMIDLLCDVDVQPFYEALGMQRTQGMLLRHYHNQTGFHPDDAGQ